MTDQTRKLEEEASRRQEIEAKAIPADSDTEALLVELKRLADQRKPHPIIEARYEELRALLTERLGAEGVRYFIDADHVKRYAYVTQQYLMDVDLEALTKMHDAGEIPDEVWEEIAPRQVDRDGLRRAIQRGGNPRSRKPGLTPHQVVEAISFRPKTPWVSFGDPESADGP